MKSKLESIADKLGWTGSTDGAIASAARAPGRRSVKSMPLILVPDIRITGDIKGDGEVQIDGPLDGNVDAGSVVVGPAGVVTGSIKADTVVVSGTVVGDIGARIVTLTKTARLNGRLAYSEALYVDGGARYSGKVVYAEQLMEKAAGLTAVTSGRRPTNGGAPKPNWTGIGAKTGTETSVGPAAG